MASDFAIKVQGLGKRYLLSHARQERYVALRDVIARSAQRIVHRVRRPFTPPQDSSSNDEFWALRDIDFAIRPGERVGIVGRNGAGKSTLLKLLSRITAPTTGRMELRGRVASLLEVGTGFHPELTGRENIYLNGAILGMRRTEIRHRFEEIVDFADVERFLDTPVKRYSSGMYVRLAFAVAAHLDPDILAVDEILAVGDAAFQQKSMRRMRESSTDGRTLLFVSHNMGALNALCERSILLEKGRLVADGPTADVLSQYLKNRSEASSHHYVSSSMAQDEGRACLLEAVVLNSELQPSPILPVDQPGAIRFRWRLSCGFPFLRVGIELVDASGVVVGVSVDTDSTELHGKPRAPGTFESTVTLPEFLLMPGLYSVSIFVGMPGVERILEASEVLAFEVLDNQTHLGHVPGSRRQGYIALPLNWSVERSKC